MFMRDILICHNSNWAKASKVKNEPAFKEAGSHKCLNLSRAWVWTYDLVLGRWGSYKLHWPHYHQVNWKRTTTAYQQNQTYHINYHQNSFLLFYCATWTQLCWYFQQVSLVMMEYQEESQEWPVIKNINRWIHG